MAPILLSLSNRGGLGALASVLFYLFRQEREDCRECHHRASHAEPPGGTRDSYHKRSGVYKSGRGRLGRVTKFGIRTETRRY